MDGNLLRVESFTGGCQDEQRGASLRVYILQGRKFRRPEAAIVAAQIASPVCDCLFPRVGSEVSSQAERRAIFTILLGNAHCYLRPLNRAPSDAFVGVCVLSSFLTMAAWGAFYEDPEYSISDVGDVPGWFTDTPNTAGRSPTTSQNRAQSMTVPHVRVVGYGGWRIGWACPSEQLRYLVSQSFSEKQARQP